MKYQAALDQQELNRVTDENVEDEEELFRLVMQWIFFRISSEN